MVSVIFCISPFFIMAYYFLILRKRESLDWYIKKGHICYNCKEDLNISEDDSWDRLASMDNYSKLCVSCNRDRKISSINNQILSFKYKFQNFMVSPKYDKMNLLFLLIIVFSIGLDVILKLNNIKLDLWIIYGSSNIIWWSLIIWKTLYTTRKKPSE